MNVQPEVRDDPEAEIAALALAIHYPDVRKDLAELPTTIFHCPLKRRIRGLIVDLGRDNLTAIPRQSIISHWPTGEFAPEAGQALLDSIYAYSAYPTHWPHYRSRLLDAANARKALRALEHLWTEVVSGSRNGHLGAALKEVNAAVAEVGREEQGAEVLIPVTAADWKEDEPVAVEFGASDGEALVVAGDLILLGGNVGDGKSYFVLGLCIAKALGKPCAGFPCPEAARSAYIAADHDARRKIIARRAIRLIRGFDADPAALHGPNLRVFAPEHLSLDNERDYDSVRRFLDAFDPALVGFASLNTLAGPDRKRADDAAMMDFYAIRLRPLQARPDGAHRTLIVEAHLRKLAQERGAKGLNDPLQRVSGSYYIPGGANAVIGIEGQGPERFLARPVKRSPSGLTFSPFLCRIEGKPPADPIRLVNLGGVQRSAPDLGNDENAFLEAMVTLSETAGPGGWVRVRQVKARLGVGPAEKTRSRNLERAGKRLVDKGRLEAHREIAGCYRLPTDDRDMEPGPDLFGGDL